MLYDIQGRVIAVGKTQAYGSKGFQKRGIVIDAKGADDKYPNTIEFTAVNDKCQMLDGYKAGDAVKIRFALDGRKWDGGDKGVRYFCDLKIIKIERIGEQSSDDNRGAAEADAEDEMPF